MPLTSLFAIATLQFNEWAVCSSLLQVLLTLPCCSCLGILSLTVAACA